MVLKSYEYSDLWYITRQCEHSRLAINISNINKRYFSIYISYLSNHQVLRGCVAKEEVFSCCTYLVAIAELKILKSSSVLK